MSRDVLSLVDLTFQLETARKELQAYQDAGRNAAECDRREKFLTDKLAELAELRDRHESELERIRNARRLLNDPAYGTQILDRIADLEQQLRGESEKKNARERLAFLLAETAKLQEELGLGEPAQ